MAIGVDLVAHTNFYCAMGLEPDIELDVPAEAFEAAQDADGAVDVMVAAEGIDAAVGAIVEEEQSWGH